MRAGAVVVGVAAAALTLLAAGGAAAMQLSGGTAQLYSSVSIYPPDNGTLTVCYGFVCRQRMTITFTAADRAALARIMAKGKLSAVTERAAVQAAVVWFDRKLGPIIGTDKRIARAALLGSSASQNFDCWDTTRNTTSLLLILQEWGLLTHHRVGDPKYRGNVLVLQTPHNTATLVEKANGAEWAVDMWTTGYGQKPEVMTVEAWMPLH